MSNKYNDSTVFGEMLNDDSTVFNEMSTKYNDSTEFEKMIEYCGLRKTVFDCNKHSNIIFDMKTIIPKEIKSFLPILKYNINTNESYKKKIYDLFKNKRKEFDSIFFQYIINKLRKQMDELKRKKIKVHIL